ncbi:MAG: hypothetical protein AAFR99_22190 [Cyanobacteria bacterium J06629_9]
MDWLLSAALVAIAPTLPNNTAQLEQPAPEPSPPAPAVGQPLSCPPGQFASAFSDVYPTDWAYEAVNRLAGVPIECFDWPEFDLRNEPQPTAPSNAISRPLTLFNDSGRRMAEMARTRWDPID